MTLLVKRVFRTAATKNMPDKANFPKTLCRARDTLSCIIGKNVWESCISGVAYWRDAARYCLFASECYRYGPIFRHGFAVRRGWLEFLQQCYCPQRFLVAFWRERLEHPGVAYAAVGVDGEGNGALTVDFVLDGLWREADDFGQVLHESRQTTGVFGSFFGEQLLRLAAIVLLGLAGWHGGVVCWGGFLGERLHCLRVAVQFGWAGWHGGAACRDGRFGPTEA